MAATWAGAVPSKPGNRGSDACVISRDDHASAVSVCRGPGYGSGSVGADGDEEGVTCRQPVQA